MSLETADPSGRIQIQYYWVRKRKPCKERSEWHRMRVTIGKNSSMAWPPETFTGRLTPKVSKWILNDRACPGLKR